MWLGSEQIDEMFIQKSGAKIQCTKVPHFCLENSFFHTYSCGICTPVPTPSSPDKAISANSVKSPLNKEKRRHSTSGGRRKFWWGAFIQWLMVVICLWCAVFVTSQSDVIFMFPNQRFGEVCWHNMHILLHALPLFLCHCTEYKLSALQVGYRRKINSMLRHRSS